jgi:hypothetical protein
MLIFLSRYLGFWRVWKLHESKAGCSELELENSGEGIVQRKQEDTGVGRCELKA